MEPCEGTVVVQIAGTATILGQYTVDPIRYRHVLGFVHWSFAVAGRFVVAETKKMAPASINTLFQSKVPRESDLLASRNVPITYNPEMVFALVGKVGVEL